MSDKAVYIHGTAPEEQRRLLLLNELTNPAFLEFLNLVPEMSVLEAGCGLGVLLREAAAQVGPRGRVAGIDYSAAQLAAAKHYQLTAPSWMGEPAPLALARGDAARLPFRDGSFDLAYCRYLLEHVADPAAVLRELRRVTQPGGRVHAQENDLRALTLHPEVPSFTAAWNAFCDLQIELGGDPWLGRKLHSLFIQAGFKELEASIAPEIHAAADPRARLQDWTDNLIGNLESAKSRLLSSGRLSPANWGKTLAELAEWRKHPDAALFFYWNRVSAVRN